MTDPGSARDVNEAAWRFAEILADSYGLVCEQAEGSAEAVAFPIEGYDRMNVEEISSRLGGPPWRSCSWFATTRNFTRGARRCSSKWTAR